MTSTTQAMFSSWSIDVKIVIALIVIAVLYLRGWRKLHRSRPKLFPATRPTFFFAGLFALWFAIASPLDAFSNLLLTAHMIQHLLLMSVVPPLILLGAPMLPILRGLPATSLREGVGPFLAWPKLRNFGRFLTNPTVCWLAMAISLCAWHVPALFELALRSQGWHKFEHACFFFAAILFWWPVVLPFPARAQWPRWSIPIYLLAADLLNTALCGILTFSETPLYPTYATAPRIFGTTAISDQVTAGVIMWVPGSLIFLIPAAVILIQLLSPTSSFVRPQSQKPASPKPRRPISLKVIPAKNDVLTIPFLGNFLRAKSGRRILQTAMLLLAILVIVDGFRGTQTAASNLAGVLPWTYGRAFAVVGLLSAGNFFCMACPFSFVRDLGRKIGINQRNWPVFLRSKWLAIALLAVFFWATEALSLWDRPMWTAWIVIGYFLAAFVIDTTFRGASFCKYVCPIGQFNFITSLVSPLEVKVRDANVCATCTTHDCLRGNEKQRGCEMDLYLPRKSGNLDCTFCLDCVRACPHDNIGVIAVVPGRDLMRDVRRSSIGRLSRRVDIATLATLLVFAAFITAAAMTAPFVQYQHRVSSPILLAALVIVPIAMIVSAGLFSRAFSPARTPLREIICRFALALVPIGAAMWAGHFLFHLLAGYLVAWPVFQYAMENIGVTNFGIPDWSLSRFSISVNSILILQTILLDAGLLLTLYVIWRIAKSIAARARSAVPIFLPWACVAVILFAVGLWILLQPMEMRGLMEAMQ